MGTAIIIVRRVDVLSKLTSLKTCTDPPMTSYYIFVIRIRVCLVRVDCVKLSGHSFDLLRDVVARNNNNDKKTHTQNVVVVVRNS